MTNNKFENFIKKNSSNIYSDNTTPEEGARYRFEQLINDRHNGSSKSITKIRHISYWLSAAVVILGLLLFSQVYENNYLEQNVNLDHKGVLSYMEEVNDKIDSLIYKVEQLDDSSHTLLIADLKELKNDNSNFIRSSSEMDEKFLEVAVLTLKTQQMSILSKIEDMITVHENPKGTLPKT